METGKEVGWKRGTEEIDTGLVFSVSAKEVYQ